MLETMITTSTTTHRFSHSYPAPGRRHGGVARRGRCPARHGGVLVRRRRQPRSSGDGRRGERAARHEAHAGTADESRPGTADDGGAAAHHRGATDDRGTAADRTARRPWQSIRRARRSWRPSSPSTRPRVSSSAPASRCATPTARSPRRVAAHRRSTRRAGPSIPTCRGTSAAPPRRSSPSSCCSSPTRVVIDLDAGIDRYVPYLPGADRITPRQLLNHTSGLGEYLDQPATSGRAQATVDAGRAGRHRRSGRTVRRAGRTAPLLEHQLHRSGRHHRAGHRPVLGRRGAGPDRRAVGHDPHRSHRHAGSCFRSRRRHPGRRHRRLRPVHRRRRRRAPVDEPRPADLRQGARRRHARLARVAGGDAVSSCRRRTSPGSASTTATDSESSGTPWMA